MESSNPLVSIVLPVYNGERFLQRAIESVFIQTEGNWELLIVNDGSTDGSSAICDEYVAKDSRLKVFHQPNGGVNSARAKGVDNATGTYLTFLDADDSFTPTALEEMAGCFSDGIDLVSSGNKECVLDRTDFIKVLWSRAILPGVWGKMFRTSLFKEIDYSLDRRMAMGEDLLLNSIYSLHIEKARITPADICIINKHNPDSVTKTFKHNWDYEKYFFRKVEEYFLSKCRDWDSFEEIELLVNKSWLNAMKYTMLDGNRIDYSDHEFKSVRDYFKTRKGILGPSERMIFTIKNPYLYRMILRTAMKLKR